MKVLVLGGNGMLGQHFLTAWQQRHEIMVTLRNSPSHYAGSTLLKKSNSFYNCDVRNTQHISKLMQNFKPDAVVNATGVTKQLAGDNNTEAVIEINALLPHKLAQICEQFDARMIQFSSDCIFSGKQGNYIESDTSDAEDLYGKTKFLGEVDLPHVVTLRKSTIGLELSGFHGLIEWFLAQEGEIKGFQKAIYSGLISNELVNVVEMILMDHKGLSGIWNVASSPISKYDLLIKLQQRLNLNKVHIVADDNFICDRSLDSSKFEKATGYIPPTWDYMLDDLAFTILNKK
ncbi:MAG: sugar nucleotide-binding protein [Methylococcaceae bacterium]|nr:sugar nucleotide-binding protein [Methylococcaceae bacterium]